MTLSFRNFRVIIISCNPDYTN